MRVLTHTSTITHAELQWACWDISDDIETQTKPHRQSRVCGRKHMRQQGWANAVKDTGKEVKAAAERGVSLSPGKKKNNTGGEAEGETREWTKHQNMKVKTQREDQGIRGGLRLNMKDVGRKVRPGVWGKSKGRRERTSKAVWERGEGAGYSVEG